MKNYTQPNGHERTSFTTRDVYLLRPYIAKVQNTHEAWTTVAARFKEDEVNISSKQVAVLERSLHFAGQPDLETILNQKLFTTERSFKGSRESATRAVMSLLDQYQYGDWTHREEYMDLPRGWLTMEVSTNDGPYYFAFEHRMDLDAAEMGLEGVLL